MLISAYTKSLPPSCLSTPRRQHSIDIPDRVYDSRSAISVFFKPNLTNSQLSLEDKSCTLYVSVLMQCLLQGVQPYSIAHMIWKGIETTSVRLNIGVRIIEVSA